MKDEIIWKLVLTTQISGTFLWIWRINIWIGYPFNWLCTQVIASEGEHKSSRALKDAADILSTSPAALQLR